MLRAWFASSQEALGEVEIRLCVPLNASEGQSFTAAEDWCLGSGVEFVFPLGTGDHDELVSALLKDSPPPIITADPCPRARRCSHS